MGQNQYRSKYKKIAFMLTYLNIYTLMQNILYTDVIQMTNIA